jgi:hypothetical protein
MVASWLRQQILTSALFLRLRSFLAARFPHVWETTG